MGWRSIEPQYSSCENRHGSGKLASPAGLELGFGLISNYRICAAHDEAPSLNASPIPRSRKSRVGDTACRASSRPLAERESDQPAVPAAIELQTPELEVERAPINLIRGLRARAWRSVPFRCGNKALRAMQSLEVFGVVWRSTLQSRTDLYEAE